MDRELIGRIIGYALLMFGFALIAHSAVAFIRWDFYPGDWKPEQRFLVVMLFCLEAIVYNVVKRFP